MLRGPALRPAVLRPAPLRALVLLLTAAWLLSVAAPTASAPTGATRTTPTNGAPTTATPAATPGSARTPYTPTTELLVTDPIRDPDGISSRLIRLIEGTPAGAEIEVTTYVIDSGPIVDALVAAHRRGVAVRIITERRQRRDAPAIERLVRALAAPGDGSPATDSWVRFVSGSSRGAGGAMHQKSYRFSRVGAAENVTVVGSYNSARIADRRSYAVMHQVVGAEEVYDAFAAVFADQRRDRDTPQAFHAESGEGWEAYFFPAARPRTAAVDPVIDRLAGLPATPSTTIRIAMFSMWDERGQWIAARLAAMARRGARISLVAGPTVSPAVQEILRAGGVRVRSGCFADGTFTHSKDMSASFVRDGRRQRWTWVGSDNWTSNGMASDEAVLGLQDQALYDDFGAAFRRLVERRDAVPTDRCDPI